MELVKPLPTLPQVGFPRRWILRLWDLCAGGSLRNTLGATPVREQGKQDWTEERVELWCSHSRTSQLVPWEALELGWPFRVVINQGKWTGPLYEPSSPLHSQPSLDVYYTLGGCVTFGEAATISWGKFLGGDSAVNYQQATPLAAGEISASDIKRKSGYGTRLYTIPSFLIFSGFYWLSGPGTT